jgi:hypothetical protein
MPLHDHFRSPVNDTHSWDEVHGGWPGEIVRHLTTLLPAGSFLPARPASLFAIGGQVSSARTVTAIAPRRRAGTIQGQGFRSFPSFVEAA